MSLWIFYLLNIVNYLEHIVCFIRVGVNKITCLVSDYQLMSEQYRTLSDNDGDKLSLFKCNVDCIPV